MAKKIAQKIVDYSVHDQPYSWLKQEPISTPTTTLEEVVRPDVLSGSTYKITTPFSEHPLYITINNIVINELTSYEEYHPFEIFIHSKNMENFQWIVAMTSIISRLFKSRQPMTLIIKELNSIFDPKGGYFKPDGRYMPSVVAEIGEVIQEHVRMMDARNAMVNTIK